MKKAVLICVLVFGFQIYAQEKYFDKEIGFDKKQLSEEIMKTDKNISEEELNRRLNAIRNNLVEIKKAGGFEKWIVQKQEKKPSSTSYDNSLSRQFIGCTNFDFETGLLSNWCFGYNMLEYTYEDSFTEGYTCEEGTANFLSEFNQFRFEVVDDGFEDSWLSSINESVTDVGNHVLKLGNDGSSYRKEMAEMSFMLDDVDDFIYYEYAVILEDPNHPERPFFLTEILIDGEPIPCSRIVFEAFSSIPGFINSPLDADVKVRRWNSNVIRPSDFGAEIGDEITFRAQVSDCGAGAHFGYAYIDVACLNPEDVIIVNDGVSPCAGQEVSFATLQEVMNPNTWKIFDSNGTLIETFVNVASPTYNFSQPGQYTVEIEVEYFTTGTNCSEYVSTFTRIVNIVDCPPDPCEGCNSFKPIPNKKYVLSAWTKENISQQVISYQDASIEIKFLDANDNEIGQANFSPSGKIIEEWQRIQSDFTVPEGAASIEIILKNKGNAEVFFDDIRIHPYNGNMKSFVYDPQTQRLMAELDENNYSTFYEYDKEGGLVRVKKETEKGVYTIQETRSKTSIQD